MRLIANVEHTEALRRQVETQVTRKLPFPRLILSVSAYANGVDTGRFELMFYGGVLPSCCGGFVQGGNVFSRETLDEAVRLGLADVAEYSSLDDADQVHILGSSWGVYLYTKLRQDKTWSKRKWADADALSDEGQVFVNAIATELGKERISFTWTSDIAVLNEWLCNCDLHLSAQAEQALVKLLTCAGGSLEEWRKLREH
jgi:hypothetical protein